MSNVFGYIAGIVVGGLIAIQAVASSTLGLKSGSPSFSVLVSFLVGFIPVFIYFLIESKCGKNVVLEKDIQWWVWISGVIGALFLITITIFVRQIGVAVLLAIIFAAQMVMGCIIDHFGLLGMPQKKITEIRGVGVVLLLFGTILLGVVR